MGAAERCGRSAGYTHQLSKIGRWLNGQIARGGTRFTFSMCIVYSVLQYFFWGKKSNFAKNRNMKNVSIFNPNIRGIGEESPTFVQNSFTP